MQSAYPQTVMDEFHSKGKEAANNTDVVQHNVHDTNALNER